MRRVLLVDDSRNVRRMLEACLQPWGFEVHHAGDGAVALGQLRASPFDLVFLDINMPVLDGPSLLRVLRAQGIQVPVVLVTSGAATNVIASTVKLGASEYVSKPFTPRQIRDVVARALHLDLASLPQYRPRVLFQGQEGDAGGELRAHLPEHVELDAVATLKDALVACESAAYALVLFDARLVEAADLLRARQRDAGLLAMLDGDVDRERMFEVEPPLDGVVPRTLDDALVRDVLYPNFLRPLAFAEGGTIRASGYEGAPAHLGAYFRQLGRALRSRAELEVQVAPDVALDLCRVPPDAARVAALVRGLCADLDALGAAAAFTVTPEVRERLVGPHAIANAVVLVPGR